MLKIGIKKTVKQVTTKPTQYLCSEAKVAQGMKKRIMKGKVKGFRESKNTAKINLLNSSVFSQC